MSRFTRTAFAFGLGLGMLLTPVFGPMSAWADDEDNVEETRADEGELAEFRDAVVSGLVYGIRSREGAQVVTIYDVSIGSGGLGVDVYVRDPGLLALITNGTLCVGRFVTASGVRTSPNTMDAQGFQIDTTKACGTPPQ